MSASGCAWAAPRPPLPRSQHHAPALQRCSEPGQQQLCAHSLVLQPACLPLLATAARAAAHELPAPAHNTATAPSAPGARVLGGLDPWPGAQIAFLHGHQTSWHSGDMRTTLQELRWENVWGHTDLNRIMPGAGPACVRVQPHAPPSMPGKRYGMQGLSAGPAA